MKVFKILFFLFIFSSCIANVKQDNFRKHVVAKGETVYQIAKQYQVTPLDIYKLNPDAINGIEESSILLIPKLGVASVGIEKYQDAIKRHKVLTKETLYSIAKLYEVSVADLQEWNEELLKDGLKIDQEIVVSAKYKAFKKDVVDVEKTKVTSKVFSHEVLSQETKYGIAKKYNLTIEQLEKLNPQIVESLEIGQILKIKEDTVTTISNNSTNSSNITNVPKPSSTKVLDSYYVVKPNETLYTLAEAFKVSQESLMDLNPELKLGLREGMVLKIPTTTQVNNPIVLQSNDSLVKKKPIKTVYVNKEEKNLISLINKKVKKNLVLLLPFNMNKIETDSIQTQKDFIINNKFLNLTLDFYSGAIMAIDSAKVLGLPVHVKILDVESSKSSSNVAQLIAKNDFSKVDAVIGPFMYSHLETTAQLLSKYKTPVISPLSKEMGVSLENLYYSVPSQDNMIKTMFDYFEKNNGNVVAIISGKKVSSKESLEKNYPNVKYANFTDKGYIEIESFKSMLVKGQKNFVILDTEKAGLILHATKTLKTLKADYDIQLAVLELYDTLDFEEIPMSSLVDLNMMFPSYKKEIDTDAGRIFEKKYKKINNVTPNSYAIKGFDVTFDALLRICQEEGFTKSIETVKTNHVENSFDYILQDGKNVNNGIFIMYYDTDYSIKQAQ
jgi:LysM repeat protein